VDLPHKGKIIVSRFVLWLPFYCLDQIWRIWVLMFSLLSNYQSVWSFRCFQKDNFRTLWAIHTKSHTRILQDLSQILRCIASPALIFKIRVVQIFTYLCNLLWCLQRPPLKVYTEQIMAFRLNDDQQFLRKFESFEAPGNFILLPVVEIVY
jgi:hypothetical protein